MICSKCNALQAPAYSSWCLECSAIRGTAQETKPGELIAMKLRAKNERLTQALAIAKDALKKIRIQKGSSHMIVTAEEALKDIEKVME